MNITNPRIGLLNNGTEADKGDNPSCHDLLLETENINFIEMLNLGIANGVADAVVTDGLPAMPFETVEGTALSMFKMIKGSL